MTDEIIDYMGWWWPAADTDARPVILRDLERDVWGMLQHTPGRDCIIQAGANVGVYPITLAEHFQKVVTVEPHPVNAACLVKNIEARDHLERVTAFEGAFGAKLGNCVPVVLKPHNCGAHMVTFDTGDVPVWTIDGLVEDLGLTAVDAIWLDAEGSELPALEGAKTTIERFAPTISVEDKGLHRHFNIPNGALQAFLAERGYVQVDEVGRDKIFRRTAS